MVFDSFKMFVKEADALCVSKAHAFPVIAKLLKSRTERYLRSIRNCARYGYVICYLEVVNLFLRTYVTTAAIRNDINDVRNIVQQPPEYELSNSARINDATHRCGSVDDEIDKITLFVNGLLPSARTILTAFGN